MASITPPSEQTTAFAAYRQRWDRYFGSALLLSAMTKFAKADVAAFVAFFPTKATMSPAELDELIPWEDHENLLAQLMLCHQVDSFLLYLSELLLLILRTEPRALASSQSVTYEDVLNHQDLDSLLHWMANRTVDKKVREGSGALFSFFEDSLHLKLFTSEQQRTECRIAVEMRNLFVHREGIVDESFQATMLGLAGTQPTTLGQRIGVAMGELHGHASRLYRAGASIDGRATDKFGLPTVQVPPFDDSILGLP